MFRFKKYLIFFMIFNSYFLINAYFDNVLLIINYNFAHYGSISLLKKIYGPYFPNIVFYGPTPHAEVHDLPHFRGYYSYLCIADAMIKNPQYDGYLFLMDDCILNPELIKGLDLTQIWFTSLIFHEKDKGNIIDMKKGSSATNWCWWNSIWGMNPTLKVFKELPSTYKDVLQANCGMSSVLFAFSDFAYIPVSYSTDFIEVAQIFGRHNVFLEIALPSILCCISLKNDWVWLQGRGTWCANPLEQFNPDAVLNHPIKLSYKKHQLFIEQFFQELQKNRKINLKN